MKGVSSVIAIILILMIVVALAALAYTWFTGIFASITATTSTAVTTTTSGMQTSFKIESARNSSSTVIDFYIRNVGSAVFDASYAKIGVYLDDTPFVPSGGTSGNLGTQVLSAKYQFTIPAAALVCDRCPGTCKNKTEVTIATGITDSIQVVC